MHVYEFCLHLKHNVTFFKFFPLWDFANEPFILIECTLFLTFQILPYSSYHFSLSTSSAIYVSIVKPIGCFPSEHGYTTIYWIMGSVLRGHTPKES